MVNCELAGVFRLEFRSGVFTLDDEIAGSKTQTRTFLKLDHRSGPPGKTSAGVRVQRPKMRDCTGIWFFGKVFPLKKQLKKHVRIQKWQNKNGMSATIWPYAGTPTISRERSYPIVNRTTPVGFHLKTVADGTILNDFVKDNEPDHLTRSMN